MKEKLLEYLIAYAGSDYEEGQEVLLQTFIDDAVAEVSNVMYPWGFSSEKQKETIQEMALLRYENNIRRIAEYHYDKAGKAGVKSYSENGMSAVYESSGTPLSYLRGVVPIAKIV